MEAHKYTLRFTDCRYSRYLSVSGLFDILEDITMQSAERQGYGYTAMDAFCLSWIVSDWNSRLYFRPAMGEAVSVFAHVQKIGAGVLKWQYRMEAADGRTVAVASATWGAANLKEGKAMRIPEAIKEKITADDTIYLAYAHPGGKVQTQAEEKAPFVFFTGKRISTGISTMSAPSFVPSMSGARMKLPSRHFRRRMQRKQAKENRLCPMLHTPT